MQQVASCRAHLTARSSAFFTSRPVQATTGNVHRHSRRQVQVEAKGKQRMRGGMQRPEMMIPPTPPVDPDNVEFVIFVRSKKLQQWMPLSVMKGGAPANMLVKAIENDLGKKLYGNQLVKNIAQSIYQDKEKLETTIRQQFPPLKSTKEFEYAFKIRDKENPKDWYLVKDLQQIPPPEEISGSAFEEAKESVSSFLSKLGGGLGVGAKQ